MCTARRREVRSLPSFGSDFDLCQYEDEEEETLFDDDRMDYN